MVSTALSSTKPASAAPTRKTDRLYYRGYAIEALVREASYTEVAYLVVNGELPDTGELTAYRKVVQNARALPGPLATTLERVPRTTHPMDVLRTGCSLLGNLEPDAPSRQEIENEIRTAD